MERDQGKTKALTQDPGDCPFNCPKPMPIRSGIRQAVDSCVALSSCHRIRRRTVEAERDSLFSLHQKLRNSHRRIFVEQQTTNVDCVCVWERRIKSRGGYRRRTRTSCHYGPWDWGARLHRECVSDASEDDEQWAVWDDDGGLRG
jgi:hypothetical protein